MNTRGPKPCLYSVVNVFPTLRNDLATDDDAERGADDGDQAAATRQLIHQNGERVVHQHVAKQQRAQQEISTRTNLFKIGNWSL